MRDALDVTGAGYEYDFIWLFIWLIVCDCIWFYICIVEGYNTGMQQWCDLPGCKDANLPTNKLNKKLSPHFIYILVCSILFLAFSNLLFSAFFGSFWTVVVFGWFRVLVVYRNPLPGTVLFINFFWMLARGPYDDQWAPFSYMFPTLWPKPVATQLVCNLIFLNNFLLGYARNSYNQHGFSKRYLHNSQLTKANADNETIHNAFGNGWL